MWSEKPTLSNIQGSLSGPKSVQVTLNIMPRITEALIITCTLFITFIIIIATW